MSAANVRCPLLLALLIATLCASRASSPGVRVTVAGDSLALGVGASDSSRGFAFDLFRKIASERGGSEVTNLAIAGATARDVERLEVPRIAATHPDLVLLEAGANDGVRHRSAAAFARDYVSLARAVRTVAPRARLVFFNVPDITVSPIFEDAAKPQLRRLLGAYNRTVSGRARATGAALVDLFHICERANRSDGRFFSADLFHPSDVGYAAIAAASWPVVRRAVRSGP